jgi:hypothetical protein
MWSACVWDTGLGIIAQNASCAMAQFCTWHESLWPLLSRSEQFARYFCLPSRIPYSWLCIITGACALQSIQPNTFICYSFNHRLCGLVVRVLGYRSGVVGLERGSLSLVSTTDELLERKNSGSGLESREYGCRDPSRWSRSTIYPQKLTLTSLTSGGRSVGIVRSRTLATEFSLFFFIKNFQSKCQYLCSSYGIPSFYSQLSIYTVFSFVSSEQKPFLHRSFILISLSHWFLGAIPSVCCSWLGFFIKILSSFYTLLNVNWLEYVCVSCRDLSRWPRDITSIAKVGTNFVDKRRSFGQYSSLAD